MSTTIPAINEDTDLQPSVPIPPATEARHDGKSGPLSQHPRAVAARNKRKRSVSSARKPKESTAPAEDPRSTLARKAVQARWATESEVQADLVALVNSLSMEDALQLVYRMRQNCELAAKTYEARRLAAETEQQCTTCGKTRAQMGLHVWRMQTYRIDPKTQTKFPVQFCSDVCVIDWNRKNTGVAAMSDRGVQGDSTRHQSRKTALMQHQEKIGQDKALADLGKQMAEMSQPK